VDPLEKRVEFARRISGDLKLCVQAALSIKGLRPDVGSTKAS
jgi:hypothetical protein